VRRCGNCQLCWREDHPHGNMPKEVQQRPIRCWSDTAFFMFEPVVDVATGRVLSGARCSRCDYHLVVLTGGPDLYRLMREKQDVHVRLHAAPPRVVPGARRLGVDEEEKKT